MHGNYRLEESHARIQEIARQNAEHRKGIGYDVALADGPEGVAIIRSGTKLPAEIAFIDPAKARDLEKDLAAAERMEGDDGYYPTERWTIRVVDVSITWADGQAQRFDRAFRIA